MRTLLIVILSFSSSVLSNSNQRTTKSLVIDFIQEISATEVNLNQVYNKYFMAIDDSKSVELAIEYLKLVNQEFTKLDFDEDDIEIKLFDQQSNPINLDSYFADKEGDVTIREIFINGKRQFLYENLEDNKLRILIPLNSGKKGVMII